MLRLEAVLRSRGPVVLSVCARAHELQTLHPCVSLSAWSLDSTLNISRRISSSCPRLNLTRDCVQPPVPMSWFLPHADLDCVGDCLHFWSQELGHGTCYSPVSPPRRLSPHSGDSENVSVPATTASITSITVRWS